MSKLGSVYFGTQKRGEICFQISKFRVGHIRTSNHFYFLPYSLTYLLKSVTHVTQAQQSSNMQHIQDMFVRDQIY